MATIFDKAKQLANKINDEINKDKWDTNCINTALFNDEPYTNIPKKEAVDPNTSTVIPYSDAGVAAPVFDPMAGNDRPKTKESSITPVVPAPAVAPAAPAAPPTPSNSGYVKPVFKSRFGGPGGSGYVTSKVPNSNGLRSLADLPVVDRSQSISSIGTMEANRILEEQAEKERAASNLPTQLPQQSIVPQIPKAVQQAQQPAPQQAAPAEESTERCYYVLIKHTKTYPAPGSMVMMRMCDSKYVWTDEAGEDQKPAYKICPHCGKKAGYTETEMD